MKSPFPGMDPYLEQHWLDVHHALTTYARDQLQSKLPRNLRARLEERVFQETARVADDPISQGYIEIIDASSSNRVVTVIEFVSPSNKVPGEGRELYLRKRREVIAAEASLVEIDLSREGERCLAARIARIPPQYQATYMACVTRAWTRDIYPLPLAVPLAAIGVPLRKSDDDVSLDLQVLIDQCYENGGYDTIDYRQPLEPPLEEGEAARADEWLRTKGMR